MAKSLPIQQLIDFKLHDDYIETPKGIFLFYRYFPPNASIMTDQEIADEIEQFSRFLDSLRRSITLFATDKIEDLSEIKKFYLSQPLEFEHINSDIVNSIESSEVKSTSVQRAFYFILKTDNPDDDIYNQIVGRGYRIDKATKRELSVLLRNYLLREFLTTDIYTIAQEVELLPKMEKTIQKKNAGNKTAELVYDREILRRLTPRRMDFKIFYGEQNNFFRKTIMIKNLPSELPPNTLQKLAGIRGTSFTMRLTPMDKGQATGMVNQQIKNRRVKRSNQSQSTQKMEAEHEESVIRNFYADILRNQNAIYYVNIYIEMYAKTKEELALLEQQIDSEIIGFAGSYESLKYEQRRAFLAVNPLGQDMFMESANNMPSKSVAALNPFSYSSRQDRNGMLLGSTVQGGNMILDLWLRDNSVTNGSFYAIGTSGQGKSYLMKKITVFQYTAGVTGYILDPDNEYTELTRKLGGTVINCASGRVKINPFEIRRLKGSADDGEYDEELGNSVTADTPVFFQHLSWLTDMFHLLFSDVEPSIFRALMIMVQDMYESKGMTEHTDFSQLKETDYPTFSDLYRFVENNLDTDYKMISREMMRLILLTIKDCYDGTLGNLLNGHTNIKNDRLICFSLAELLEGSKERTDAVLFNISSYTWNIISRRERRVMMIVDELHLFTESPIMMKYLKSYVKRGRKYNALLGVGTQQLGDIINSPCAADAVAMLNNSSFKFLFYPDKIDLALVQDKLKLTAGEVNCISVSNKQHCLLKAGNNSYYMKTGTLPYEEWLFVDAGGV